MGAAGEAGEVDRDREWRMLWREHALLEGELARLKGQRPLDWAAHAALREHLAEHRRKLAAWRARHLPGRYRSSENVLD